MREVLSDHASLAEGLEDWGERLQAITAQLNALRALQEPRCTSRVPLLGPLVAAGRRLGHWMSTQWYARPLLEQQNRFNEQVVRALDELADLLMRLRHGQERAEQALSRLGGLTVAVAEAQHQADRDAASSVPPPAPQPGPPPAALKAPAAPQTAPGAAPPSAPPKMISCPACRRAFPVTETRRPIQVRCPACGKEGVLRK
ncbi:MAG: hypothetical protein ACUVV6_00010 [Thermoplasmatota archaeon]